MESKKMGRPSLPKDKVLNAMIPIRVTAQEKGKIELAARACYLNTSEWARKILLTACQGDKM
jgi:hypothetical protein